MMENEMENGGAELVPEWVPVIEKALAKAEKYWTATDVEWAIFAELVGDLDLDAVERQVWAAHWDVDRVYHEMTGPSAKNPKVRELAWHEHDGVRHPLLWTHEYGSARVVYDALGHDEHSYRSAPRRTLVSRAALWLLGDR